MRSAQAKMAPNSGGGVVSLRSVRSIHEPLISWRRQAAVFLVNLVADAEALAILAQAGNGQPHVDALAQPQFQKYSVHSLKMTGPKPWA